MIERLKSPETYVNGLLCNLMFIVALGMSSVFLPVPIRHSCQLYMDICGGTVSTYVDISLLLHREI